MAGGSNSIYGRVRASEVENLTYDTAIGATRYVEIPSNLQQRIDYGARTDGQPLYVGFADRGIDSAASGGWIIQKFTYSGDFVSYRSIAYDSWTDRASATYL